MEPFPEAMKQLAGRVVFLAAATLRPETMYGQTNCFILPSGKYGAFEMKNDEIFICSEKAALNMAYQGLTRNPEKVEKVCDVIGETIIGLPLKAPLSVYERVYALPMLSISMEKGKILFLNLYRNINRN
jgi:leucyl-tRNA synthetase